MGCSAAFGTETRPVRAADRGEDAAPKKPPRRSAFSISPPGPPYAFSMHSLKEPHGNAFAGSPPSSFAAAIRTSGIDRVSWNGSTTGWQRVTAPACPTGARSSPHASRAVGTGSTRSASDVVSSRKDAKATTKGTFDSASPNLREDGRVNAGFVAPDRIAVRNAPARIFSRAARVPAYPLSGEGASSEASAPYFANTCARFGNDTPPGFPAFPARTLRSATAEQWNAPAGPVAAAEPAIAIPGWFLANSSAAAAISWA